MSEKKEFPDDFSDWTGAILLLSKMMISHPITKQKFRITIQQLQAVFSGGGSSGSADGGVLESVAAMNGAAQGKFYGVQLPEAHPELNMDHFALICIRGGAAEELVQLVIGWDTEMKIFLRGGEANSYDEFKEISSSSKITTIDPTSIAVGGIPAGTILTDKTTLEVIDMMLYPELFQQASGIVAPSSEFELSTTGLQEVGAELILSISHSFNRGSISPKYQSASEFRSGALIDYTETGSEGFYTVLPGVQSWTSKANYAAGVQPKGSKGTNHPSYGALPAGSTSTITRTITGVYPVYATTVNISVLTKQALLAHGAIVEVNLVAETGGNKQTVRIPSAWNITTLKQYNTFSGQWDSISLSTFTKSSAITLNGTTYYDYTHNGSTIGARKLRFE